MHPPKRPPFVLSSILLSACALSVGCGGGGGGASAGTGGTSPASTTLGSRKVPDGEITLAVAKTGVDGGAAWTLTVDDGYPALAQVQIGPFAESIVAGDPRITSSGAIIGIAPRIGSVATDARPLVLAVAQTPKRYEARLPFGVEGKATIRVRLIHSDGTVVETSAEGFQ